MRIRFDLRAIPIGRPEELVIDHAIVHETSPTHAPAVVKYLESKRENQPGESPAFVKTRQQKSRHYACLVPVLERLSDDRKLGSSSSYLIFRLHERGHEQSDEVYSRQIQTESTWTTTKTRWSSSQVSERKIQSSTEELCVFCISEGECPCYEEPGTMGRCSPSLNVCVRGLDNGMPETAQQHGDQQIPADEPHAAAVSADADVEIIAQPARQ